MTPIKEQLLQEIERTPDNLIKEVLDFLQFVKAKQEKILIENGSNVKSMKEMDGKGSRDRPIWEVFEEFTENIPEEVVAKLPTDGADQHDHYIYGTPKRTP
ncbi:hypothetical protein [Spirulina sp. 06S082]|uniref:hypothetical protein n=1 Tax=Spirulina sp. 06S082 TaxID=3110248 RepID=UPI002B208D60|nr:hypothetical protein [Spirulina sp. 06S082]MEA5469225.1 hypothetical protein [Spirulina sp. 06S082]